MPDMLMFDVPTTVRVRKGKRVYLTRALSQGGATVTNLDTGDEYTFPNGQPVCETEIMGPCEVSLQFTARSNDCLKFVMADDTYQR